jgi:hypothetical protein
VTAGEAIHHGGDIDGADRLAVALGAADLGCALVQLHGVVPSLGRGGSRLRCGCEMPGVICLEPGLHPTGGDWRRRATTRPARIGYHARRDPLQNWGVALGDLSGGVVAIDVKGEVGAAGLASLESALGKLPVTASTWWSDRRQLWFNVPPDAPMPHGRHALLAPRLPAGVALLADGDVIPLPMSRVGGGEVVRWLSTPTLTPIAPLPFGWADHLALSGGVARPWRPSPSPSARVFGPRPSARSPDDWRRPD